MSNSNSFGKKIISFYLCNNIIKIQNTNIAIISVDDYYSACFF